MVTLQALQATTASSSASSSQQEQTKHEAQAEHEQVLTRSVIPSLVTTLDASDVLECYYLTRRTVLHGLANNTVTVTKAALGLRQLQTQTSTAASSPTRRKKRPLELTLEYGPSRQQRQQSATSMLDDSIPRVIWENDVASGVAWDNQARVYYSTQIAAHETANYLASISGAVVNSLLTAAVAYTTDSDVPHAQRNRRYQPFTVVADNTTIFPSSSDVDFLQYLYQHLANLGVALDPVLRPAHIQVRLHAQPNWEFVQVTSSGVLTADVASFYARLTSCVTAMAVGDYSAYTSAEPSTSPSSGPSLAPVVSSRTPTASKTSTEPSTSPPQSSTAPSSAPSVGHNRRLQQQPLPDSTSQEPTVSVTFHEAQDNNDDNSNPTRPQQDDSTSTQQLLAKAAVTSGDAFAMTRSSALCFSDPLFGLVVDDDNSTSAYLYWDGTFFVHVQLVPPYMSVQPLQYNLPQPKTAASMGGGDVVDWTLALLLTLSVGVGFLLLLQQVMGRNLRIIRPLYKFQRWFFDPMHYDSGPMDDRSEIGSRTGGGHEYMFGEDVIPLSMGGRRASAVQVIRVGDGTWRSTTTTTAPTHHSHHSGGDLEMVLRGSNGSHDSGANSEDSDVMLDEMASETTTSRLFRDPDLVDLPDLTSTTKVAVPFIESNRGGSSSHGVEME